MAKVIALEVKYKEYAELIDIEVKDDMTPEDYVLHLSRLVLSKRMVFCRGTDANMRPKAVRLDLAQSFSAWE